MKIKIFINKFCLLQHTLIKIIIYYNNNEILKKIIKDIIIKFRKFRKEINKN